MHSRFTILCLSALFASCTPTASKHEVGRLQGDLGSVRVSQASVTAQLGALDSKIRELQGKLEELQFSVNQKLEIDNRNIQLQINEMAKRLPPPSIVPLYALEEDEQLSPDQEFVLEFLSTIALVRRGDFRTAKEALIQQASNANQLRPNILFWLGLCLEALGEDRAALNAYFDLTQDYKKHSRVALALLRQAGVLVKIGDHKTAQLLLKKIIAEHPKSIEAEKAKEKLK